MPQTLFCRNQLTASRAITVSAMMNRRAAGMFTAPTSIEPRSQVGAVTSMLRALNQG